MISAIDTALAKVGTRTMISGDEVRDILLDLRGAAVLEDAYRESETVLPDELKDMDFRP